MNPPYALDAIRATIADALAKACPEGAPPEPAIRWSRAYSYCGRALIVDRRAIDGAFASIVVLSSSWRAATPEGQRQTLVHEAMHIADAWLHPGQPLGHGWPWRVLMLKVGVPAEAASKDPGANAANALARWRRDRWVFCPCSAHRVSARAHNGYATGTRPGTCRRCRCPISPRPYDLETSARLVQGVAA